MLRPTESWYAANYQYLLAAIAQVLTQIGRDGEAALAEPTDTPLGWSEAQPAAIELLCERLGLSPFERRILLVAIALELNCLADPLPPTGSLTFGWAMQWPQAHWSALTPERPLRAWQLLEVGPGSTLLTSPLRLDEGVLHYVLGAVSLDERLGGMVERLGGSEGQSSPLPNSQGYLVDVVGEWLETDADAIVQLWGNDRPTQAAIAQAICAQRGWELLRLEGLTLPLELAAFNGLCCLCERTARLSPSLVWLDCNGVPDLTEGEGTLAQLQRWITQFCDRYSGPLLVTAPSRRPQGRRSLRTLEVPRPTLAEQRQIWQMELNGHGPVLINEIEQLVAHFNLNGREIRSVCDRLPTQMPTPQHLWRACLAQARPRLDELAQAIAASVTWEDLVLPEPELRVLKTIAAHVRQRAKVYEQWGFGAKGDRGLGISALFAGPSGTGKTLAAEVLANALDLDLYRIDLSTVVSKYIGETEKNLRRIFDAAETGGAILLFDEADALFGKRSEVKDSHDRYANMEVAYLLQRIESYRGLAILTTNLKGSVDQAFLRRIRFIVQFPFPDVSQREEIWRRIFPSLTPTQDLAYAKLARLNVTGGNIRNIALNSAFLAADAQETIQMKHVLEAAQAEYIKLERPLTETEVKGWLAK